MNIAYSSRLVVKYQLLWHSLRCGITSFRLSWFRFWVGRAKLGCHPMDSRKAASLIFCLLGSFLAGCGSWNVCASGCSCSACWSCFSLDCSGSGVLRNALAGCGKCGTDLAVTGRRMGGGEMLRGAFAQGVDWWCSCVCNTGMAGDGATKGGSRASGNVRDGGGGGG